MTFDAKTLNMTFAAMCYGGIVALYEVVAIYVG